MSYNVFGLYDVASERDGIIFSPPKRAKQYGRDSVSVRRAVYAVLCAVYLKPSSRVNFNGIVTDLSSGPFNMKFLK